ncbi:MAG: hypothetical protein ACJAYX_003599 [Planctomycetota bacterium]
MALGVVELAIVGGYSGGLISINTMQQTTLRVAADRDRRWAVQAHLDRAMRNLLLLLASALLSGCSTHFTTLRDGDASEATIFAIDDEHAFRLAFEAIAETLPGRGITEVKGPVRGYFTTFRFVLDTYSQQVLVFPVMGRREGGEEVRGVYYEVSGSGSSVVQGRAKNVALFELLNQKARATGNPVVVKEVAAASYQNPDQAVPSGDLAKKLTELKALRDQGLITEQDYEAKKADLLKRM